jgi:hypothetical protein
LPVMIRLKAVQAHRKMPRSSIRLLLQSQRLLRLLISSPVAVIPLPLLSAVFLFSVLAYFGCLLIRICECILGTDALFR